MRVFLTTVIVALVVVAVTGFSLGWFAVNSTSNDNDTTWSLTVNKGPWHKDRDDFRKQAEAKLKEMDKKIDDLQAKAVQAASEDRDIIVRDIKDLQQRQQVVRDELAKSATATEHRWETTKTRLTQALDDLEHGVQKAWSRFKDK